MRVKVALNIGKPLKRGRKVAIAGGDSIIVVFKYERLLDFCYIYGYLDHQELDCDDVVRMKKEGIKIQREYEPWVRAENNVLLSRKNDGQKMVSNDSISSSRIKGPCKYPILSGLLLFIFISGFWPICDEFRI